LIYGTLVALLLTFSTTAAFAQDQLQEVAPEATATVPQPTDPPPTNTPVPVITNTPVPVPTNTPVPVPPTPIPPTAVPPVTEPVQIPEPITVVLFGSGLAALSASVSKRRKNQ